MGKEQDGMTDLKEAVQEKVTEDHNVIEEAIRDRGEGYTVFSIVCISPSFLCRFHPQFIPNSPSECYIARPNQS